MKRVRAASSQVVILGDFSHTLLVLLAMFRMLVGHYIGISASLQIVVSICTVPMAGAGKCLAKSVAIIV